MASPKGHEETIVRWFSTGAADVSCHQCEEKLLDHDRSHAAVGRLMLALPRNVSPFRPQEEYRRKRKRRSEIDRTSRRPVSDRILAELESVPLFAVPYQQSEG